MLRLYRLWVQWRHKLYYYRNVGVLGIKKNQIGQGLCYKMDEAAIPTKINGMQSVNDLRFFPTKLDQKFDVDSYHEIVTLHGLKKLPYIPAYKTTVR